MQLSFQRLPLAISLSVATIAITTLSGCNNHRAMEESTPVTIIMPATQHSESATHQQVHNTTDAHIPLWSYDEGLTGPAHWGSSIDAHSVCRTGVKQSPINITQASGSTETAPITHYTPSDVDVKNNGHTIVFTLDNDDNTLMIHGEKYTLKQFHYHTPSEHQIAGVNYPAVIHFVHANDKEELAVIGVMLNPTGENTALTKLIQTGIEATQAHNTITIHNVDINKLLPTNSPYYHYSGSLTTPPCSEQVQWFVMTKPLAVSQSTLATMIQMYHDNNRPVQPVGSRTVEVINP
ncbi:carbonic anhydrase [Psychrobacter sp. I-STPA6b]|uniref:carbonic anhydrase n=1 Tax=Psychrobacter sp. I-STPA6b TaxID=2585718 RepID=UPI001D0CAEBA|nr:carbonic anhydrase family protein [Psychrobacter sp. I-STPA6b]